jgi:glycosyltransferase involved in cell wall biosynthesis
MEIRPGPGYHPWRDFGSALSEIANAQGLTGEVVPMPSQTPGAVCLVTPELDHSQLTDGIGAYAWSTAHALAAQGRRVHILHCAPLDDPSALQRVREALRDAGIGFSSLEEHPGRMEDSLPCARDTWFLTRANRVRSALKALHTVHHFDLVEFPERQALGFRAIQAKRAGLAFTDLAFAVRLHGNSQWVRESNRQWIQDAHELTLDYCERYAFEHADRQLSLSRELLDYARGIGWTVRDDAEVRADPLVPGEPIACRDPCEQPLVTLAVPYYNLGAYLPATLASLARQTYQNLEVLVINDGSTSPISLRVFGEQQRLHPAFHFLCQPNAGLGAARNRALAEARGTFFIPIDADNVARPHMVESFVEAMRRNPDVSAMTCYYLAIEDDDATGAGPFLYAYRPAGGGYLTGSLVNVFGDANAIFRTRDFRAVGGYETDRDTGYEDWEAFVKLANAGYKIDVVPEYLLYYRHRPESMLRATSDYLNHHRVLRQYCKARDMPEADFKALWGSLVGLHKRCVQLAEENGRLADEARQWREKCHGL